MHGKSSRHFWLRTVASALTTPTVQSRSLRRSVALRSALFAALFVFSTPARSEEALEADYQLPSTTVVPTGTLMMGDLSGGWDEDERPVVSRRLASFGITQTEITVGQFRPFALATNLPQGAEDLGEDLPVTGVSWIQARDFARWLSRQSGKRWRLPTEAEWEFAARAGLLTLYQTGNEPDEVCEVGNVADLSARAAGQTWETSDCDDGHPGLAPVSSYPPNALSLYDLHGNAWEWVADCYAPYAADGVVRSRCDERVIRGGSFQSPATSARFSNREKLDRNGQRPDLGFRLVLEP